MNLTLDEVVFIYFLVGLILFWLNGSLTDSEWEKAISVGLFWPVWAVVWLIKLIIYTKDEIKETFKD